MSLPKKPSVPVTDPLEGARIVDRGAAIAPTAAPVADATEPPRPDPVPPPMTPAKRLPHYRVVADKQLSWTGQTITLHVGDVVSDESYGPGGVASMLDQGVVLEEVSPPV